MKRSFRFALGDFFPSNAWFMSFSTVAQLRENKFHVVNFYLLFLDEDLLMTRCHKLACFNDGNNLAWRALNCITLGSEQTKGKRNETLSDS
jgi:hypothetical protein